MREMDNILDKLNAKYDSVLKGKIDVQQRIDKLVKENEEYKSLRRQELIKNVKQDFNSKTLEEKAVDASLLIAGSGAIAYFIGNNITRINGNLVNSIIVSVPMTLGLASAVVAPKIIAKKNHKENMEKYYEYDRIVKENNEVIELLKENMAAYDAVLEDLSIKKEYITNSLGIINVSKMINNNKVRKLAK